MPVPAPTPLPLPLAEAVVALVNERYAATEGMLLHPGTTRTHLDEVLTLAAEKRLLLLLDDTGAFPDPSSASPAVLGAVTLYPTDEPEVAAFGMLAVAPSAAGRGLGTRLVRAVEELARERGATAMDLEVLRPVEGEVESKRRLSGWYPRLGYRLRSTAPAQAVNPALSADLTVECVLDRYRLSLQ